MDLTSLLNDRSDSFNIGSIGSPSSTTEIVIDINQKSEAKQVLGQLVYFTQRQEENELVILGQISEIETQNRWHEDITFRGIIKRRGSLPHLSGRADVRTATLGVQACFSIAPDGKVSEGVLGMSPTTGSPVFSIRDEILDGLLTDYKNQIIYLGRTYATDVKLPLWLKHFDRGDGGAGEAYHIGIFGKSGSGKSGLAAYTLLGYARHQNMGIIFIDPQNQFTSDTDLPFSLHSELRALGSEVYTYRLTDQIRLGTTNNAVRLFTQLLAKTNFFKDIGVRATENQEYAVDEIRRIISTILKNEQDETKRELKSPPESLCQRVIEDLRGDNNALQRIYSSRNSLQRFTNTLQSILDIPEELERIEQEFWQPVLDLFLEQDSKENRRHSLWNIVERAATSDKRPIVFLDIQGQGTEFADRDEIKALILKEISIALRVAGEKAFAQKDSNGNNKKLNCLICLDEAHRFVKSSFGRDDRSEMSNLTQTFVDGVRTTRKYGLGYMFITQTLASLHKEIIEQLRLYAFGYGLTTGSEYRKIEELVSDKQSLNLYKSFVDPQSNKQYPFMLIGPVSPLSFTGSPLFIQMFTKHEDFKKANNL